MNAKAIGCSLTPFFSSLIGDSPAIKDLQANLERIAPSELSVLVEGETGTGKELVAESLHRASARAAGPFIVFDCSSVAPTLVESELFGHERGAFTGAVSARAGVFERAHGGTLLMDELGELPKELQPKLLRVLEKREVRRLGGSEAIPVDIRLIAATNRNLRGEVKRGTFREDLYFRVAGAHVIVPPLRERKSDLPALVAKFWAEVAPSEQVEDLPAQTWQELLDYGWPGNVRELRNVVQRLVVTPGRLLALDEAVVDTVEAPAESTVDFRCLKEARREATERFERDYVRALLRRAGGNITVAASMAQVSRQAIHKLVTKHRL